MFDSFQLLDPHGALVATGDVVEYEPSPPRVWGAIDLQTSDVEMCELFHDHEQIVNGPVLSLLDEIEERITDLAIHVRFVGGPVERVHNLQVYPSKSTVRFGWASEEATMTPEPPL